jgi:hypothetical protein
MSLPNNKWAPFIDWTCSSHHQIHTCPTVNQLFPHLNTGSGKLKISILYSDCGVQFKSLTFREITTSDNMWHLVAYSVDYSQEILGGHYCLYILSTWETSMYILTMKEEQPWYPNMVAWHNGNSILKTVYNAIMMYYHSILSWQFAPAATLP